MKNLNELITTIALIVLSIFSLRAFLFGIFSHEKHFAFFDHIELLKNYTDDESE